MLNIVRCGECKELFSECRCKVHETCNIDRGDFLYENNNITCMKKIGGSYYIRIPVSFVPVLFFHEYELLQLHVEKDKLIIERKK